MSHLFGNSSINPESSPWNAPTHLTKEAMGNLPRNHNRYTKYYGIQAPYDTDLSNPTLVVPTRFGRTVHTNTKHLIIPETQNAPSASPTMQTVRDTISNEDKYKENLIIKARVERRRNYVQEQQQRKLEQEQKAKHQSEIRQEAKTVRRERYEKIFEEKNAKYKARNYGRKAYDKNMTIEEMRAITRK